MQGAGKESTAVADCRCNAERILLILCQVYNGVFCIRAGITKAEKLLKRREFVSLSRQGKSVSDHYFIIAYQYNRLDRSRLGITITRKVGNAVTRNRLKRIIREFYRHNKIAVAKNLDINIIAKKSAAGVSSKRACESLSALLNRIGGIEKSNICF